MDVAVETRVRTVIAQALDVPAANIQPGTVISTGMIGDSHFRTIVHHIEIGFDVALPANLADVCFFVVDLVAATEDAIAADRRSAA